MKLQATGNVCRHIVDALLNDESGSFHVRIARREGNPSPSAPTTSTRAETFDVDYTSLDSLKKLFADQHAIIEAFNPNGAVHQVNIVQAALETPTVRHIITPDFSSDTFNANCGELKIFEPKIRAGRAGGGVREEVRSALDGYYHGAVF